MYKMGSPVTKGSPAQVAETDPLYYHDIGGYVQEYDVNDLSALSPQDYTLVTDEQVMAQSIWQQTIEQGFKPFYVEVTSMSTGANSLHLKITENHGYEGVPIASVGHGTFQPTVIPAIIWLIAVIVAIVVVGVVLVTFSPLIFKFFGMTPQEVDQYFSAINPFPTIAVILIAGVAGLALYAYVMRTKKKGD